MFLWLTLLTGVFYPLIVAVIALIIPGAAGSIITRDNKKIGSKLISQKFEANTYFWPRPSAVDYNPLPSGGSNLGPTSKALKEAVAKRKEALAKSHNAANLKEIPSDLLFSSGSGLDPHISPAAALFQAGRVAKARGLKEEEIIKLVERFTENRSLYLLGEPHVNVLLLNLALDELKPPSEMK